MLPERFAEQQIRVYCTKLDKKKPGGCQEVSYAITSICSYSCVGNLQLLHIIIVQGTLIFGVRKKVIVSLLQYVRLTKQLASVLSADTMHYCPTKTFFHSYI